MRQQRDARNVVNHIISANARKKNFLLNVGPDRQGRIHPGSVKVLKEVGSAVRRQLVDDGAEVRARHGPAPLPEGSATPDVILPETALALVDPETHGLTKRRAPVVHLRQTLLPQRCEAHR